MAYAQPKKSSSRPTAKGNGPKHMTKQQMAEGMRTNHKAPPPPPAKKKK